MRRLLGRRPESPNGPAAKLGLEAERGRRLVEESRELVVVLDSERCVVAASRRAREALPDLRPGEPLSDEILSSAGGQAPSAVSYEVGGRSETLVYLSEPGSHAAYEELRAGFTAAVSHELRTPLARLLALLETALLPGADAAELIGRAQAEIGQATELIDDVLFLSELETGRAVVSLSKTRVLPLAQEIVETLSERAVRAGVRLGVEGDPAAELPLRPRMLRVVIENLAENAIRYAGSGSRFTLSVGPSTLRAADDGAGVPDEDLSRLFERFYRADRARASRGTGLGLAIVKHIVTSAGGTVEAARGDEGGLAITCAFPAG